MQKAENMTHEEETKSIDIDRELIQIIQLTDDNKTFIRTPFCAPKVK